MLLVITDVPLFCYACCPLAAADVVLVGLFDTRQPYWVHQMGLKILQQQFKQKVAVEVAAGLALAFDDESDAGYSPDATVVDQCWCAGCTAVALGLEVG